MNKEELRKKILNAVKIGKGVPIGYHCNSFGSDQIEFTIKIYCSLIADVEKKYFERVIADLLSTGNHNSVWVAYVVSKVLNFSSLESKIDSLIKENKIDKRDQYVCPLIVKEMKRLIKIFKK